MSCFDELLQEQVLSSWGLVPYLTQELASSTSSQIVVPESQTHNRTVYPNIVRSFNLWKSAFCCDMLAEDPMPERCGRGGDGAGIVEPSETSGPYHRIVFLGRGR